jgi:NCS1 family nucleobase:cation symporter-1
MSSVSGRHGKTQTLEEVPQEYAAFKIEQRGIDLIPDSERQMKPSGLFWLWAGAVFNVEFFFYGTLIMASFHLSVPQAVAVILIGNLFYALLGFASLQGPKTGTTAFMVSRAPFGQNGNRLVALFNWVTQVGFEIEGIFFVVATIILLFSLHGTNLDGPAKIVVIILAALLQMVVPLLGHATISKVLRYLAYIFIVFFAVLAGFTFNRLHPSVLPLFHAKPASFAVWTTALVVIISVGGLGWTENGNDYSRYLPRDTRAPRTFWAATLGGAIPSIILELLGVFAFTIVANKEFVIPASKTVGIAQLGVPQSFPGWFVTPLLIFAVFQLLAINTIDMYSSGVTLQALGLPVRRWGAVIIDTVVCAVVTGIILFHGNFYADFSGFLLYIVVWLAPWFGILLTDYLLRRRDYHALSLRSARDGIYWRNGGIHWPAVIALLVGGFASLEWLNAYFAVPSFTGYISNHFPGLSATAPGTGGDFSWAIGIVVGALVYWLLAARSVRQEADQVAR